MGKIISLKPPALVFFRKNRKGKWGKWTDLDLVNIVSLDTNKNRVVFSDYSNHRLSAYRRMIPTLCVYLQRQ
jgi:hypothetical protein